MKNIFILFASNLLAISVFSQVANDSIENRKELHLGKTYSSYTANSTVEQSCVDETLTGKCIKYHNDQWFTFNSKNRKKIFVNITNQSCRDIRGIQLVLLTGQPCNPSSYNVLSCTSLGTNDDFYVEAEVKPNTFYLLNIDGYLKDFCKFNITLDSIPQGLPAEPNLSINSTGEIVGKVVRFNWILVDSLLESIDEFIILKKNEQSHYFTAIDTLAVRRDTYGHYQSRYTYSDTLANYNQTYNYKVAARSSAGQLYLFAEYSFKRKEDRKLVSLEFNLRKNTSLTIKVWDDNRNKVLYKEAFSLAKRLSKKQLDLTKYWHNGVDKVLIEVINNRKQKSQTQLVSLKDIGVMNRLNLIFR